MAKVLFVLGNAGSGKTHFSRKFIKSELEQKNFWCLVNTGQKPYRIIAGIIAAIVETPLRQGVAK